MHTQESDTAGSTHQGSNHNRLNRQHRTAAMEALECRALLSVAVDYVIQIWVDGLRPDAITALGPEQVPNFYRPRAEGAFTDEARTEYDYTETLPNHTTQITARPLLGSEGHGLTINSDPGTTIHAIKGSYVPSVFDVVHDRGGRTALYASKHKYSTSSTFSRSARARAEVSSTSLPLRGLKPGTRYYLRVFAVGESGLSDPSNVAQVRTSR